MAGTKKIKRPFRLAEILNKNAVTSDFREAAQSYQNGFVQKDEIIRLLLHEVSGLDKLLTREAHENGALIKAVIFKQKHLRRQVEFLEREFSKLKVQFNDYLSELE